jgi:hypothetical protein
VIRLTFVSANHRDFVKEYDTDDLAEALIAQAESFRLKEPEEGKRFSDNRGPDTWVFAFIERDDARLSQDEIVSEFKRIANLEQIRGPERKVRPPRAGGDRG